MDVRNTQTIDGHRDGPGAKPRRGIGINFLGRYACACACRPLAPASSAEILSVGVGVSTHSSSAVSLGACARLQDVHRLPDCRWEEEEGFTQCPGPHRRIPGHLLDPPPDPGPGSRPRTRVRNAVLTLAMYSRITHLPQPFAIRGPAMPISIPAARVRSHGVTLRPGLYVCYLDLTRSPVVPSLLRLNLSTTVHAKLCTFSDSDVQRASSRERIAA